MFLFRLKNNVHLSLEHKLSSLWKLLTSVPQFYQLIKKAFLFCMLDQFLFVAYTNNIPKCTLLGFYNLGREKVLAFPIYDYSSPHLLTIQDHKQCTPRSWIGPQVYSRSCHILIKKLKISTHLGSRRTTDYLEIWFTHNWFMKSFYFW